MYIALEPLFEYPREFTSNQNAKARRRGYMRSNAWPDEPGVCNVERVAQSVRGDLGMCRPAAGGCPVQIMSLRSPIPIQYDRAALFFASLSRPHIA